MAAKYSLAWTTVREGAHDDNSHSAEGMAPTGCVLDQCAGICAESRTRHAFSVLFECQSPKRDAKAIME